MVCKLDATMATPQPSYQLRMRLFHVVTDQPQAPTHLVKPGYTIDTEVGGYNPFFKNAAATPPQVNLTASESPGLLEFFRSFENEEYQWSYRPSMNELAKWAYQILQGQLKLKRELIFEQVRASEFSELPSRQRCLWVSETLSDALYWKSRLSCNARNRPPRVFIIDATGETFTAHEGHLIQEAEAFAITEARARDYWQGVPALPSFPGRDSGRYEILFKGKATFIEEIAST